MFLQRKRYLHIRNAVVLIQMCFRDHQAYQYQQKLSKKKEDLEQEHHRNHGAAIRSNQLLRKL